MVRRKIRHCSNAHRPPAGELRAQGSSESPLLPFFDRILYPAGMTTVSTSADSPPVVAKREPSQGLHGRDSLWIQFKIFIKQASPLVLLANFLGLLAWRVWHGGYDAFDAVPIVGVLIYWPLQEWAAHRWILHLKPFKVFGLTIDPEFPRKHREHHMEPWNIKLTLLPTSTVLVLVPIHIFAWILIMGEMQHALTGMVAFAGMALIYEWVHYLTHTSYVPRTSYYRRLWRNHRLHHYKSEHYWYGFIIPWVDTVLGTEPDFNQVATSPTCRNLGVDEDNLSAARAHDASA